MKRLSPKHKLMLRMYASGFDRSQVAEQIPCSVALLDRVVGSDAGKAYLKTLENELDQQFKGQYKKVIDVVGRGLESADLRIGIAAAGLWARIHGKFVQVSHSRDLTAEDIIKMILSGQLRRETTPQLPPKPVQLKGVVVTDGGDEDVIEPEEERMLS